MFRGIFDANIPIFSLNKAVWGAGGAGQLSKMPQWEIAGIPKQCELYPKNQVAGFLERLVEHYPEAGFILVHDQEVGAQDLAAKCQQLDEVTLACRQAGVDVALMAAVDFFGNDCAQCLEQLARLEAFKAVRLSLERTSWNLSYEADSFLGDKTWLNNFGLLNERNFVVEIDVRYNQLFQLYYLLLDYPDIPVILGLNAFCSENGECDAAVIPHKMDMFQNMAQTMSMYADLDNIYIKLGGLHLCDPDWNGATVWPLVRQLLNQFGEDRLIFGSNFQVNWTEQHYIAVIENLYAIMPSAKIADKVLSSNARGLFNFRNGNEDACSPGALNTNEQDRSPKV